MKRLILLLLIASCSWAQQTWGKWNGVSLSTPAATFTYVGMKGASCAATTCQVTSYSAVNGNLLRVTTWTRDTTASEEPSLATDNGSSVYANAYNTNITSGYYGREDYTLSVAGSPTTFTCTGGANTSSMWCIVVEYHRTSGTWVFGNYSALVAGTSTSPTCDPVTPTAGLPALVASTMLNLSDYATTFTTTGDYVVRGNTINYTDGSVVGTIDDIVASASGTYSATSTLAISRGYRIFSTWYK